MSLSLLIMVGCIFCVYISIIEMFELHDRRIDIQRDISDLDTIQYSVDDIVDLVEKNDIIEIEIKVSKDIIKIGSSSDSNWSDNIFFNKLYYCGDSAYESIDEFKSMLDSYSIAEMLEVISIDGLG